MKNLTFILFSLFLMEFLIFGGSLGIFNWKYKIFHTILKVLFEIF